MSITDELRGFARTFDHVWFKSDGTAIFTTGIPPIDADRGDKYMLRIADRIDSAHKHAIGYVDDRDPETMAENGWVKLPKDADGEPIHVGDTVEWLDEPRHPITVVGVGKNTLFYIDDDANAQWTMAITKRHHAKTIEEVLDEFASAYDRIGGADDEHQLYLDLITEYAAKLQLREES